MIIRIVLEEVNILGASGRSCAGNVDRPMKHPDVIVVGSGPNGLAAAVTLARAGLTVEVLEGAATPGGGCRTEELTQPGFWHDVCSAVHPLVAASPFFRRSGLEQFGVRLLTPRVAFAHPLDGGRAAAVVSSVEQTAEALGADATVYRRMYSPLVRESEWIVPAVLSPWRSVPPHPLAVARFGLQGARSVQHLAARFTTDEAQALVAGVGAHGMQPLSAPMTGGFALLLTVLAHAVGWPVVEGGSARIVDALVGELESLGSRIVTGRWVRTLGELPAVRAVLLDITPRQLLEVAGSGMPRRQRLAFGRFRYGPGVCKVDWALEGPVPWLAAACRQAGTVHLGGTLAEIAHSEADVVAGRHPDRPYCIVTQPDIVDTTRAPGGSRTLWAYGHVPSGSTVDVTERIEAQIERFAPGFKDLVVARVTRTAAQMEEHNPNYVGGDINGGAATWRQIVFRPAVQRSPYRTGLPGVYLCSASTAPGGGVHGMCGEGAARTALADLGIASRRRSRSGDPILPAWSDMHRWW
jgi:phytoene dehydrogenase-like protein